MTDDPKPAGLAAPPGDVGFEDEPITAPAELHAAVANGHDHAAAAPAASTVLDPLQVIATTEAFPEALRVTADRLLKAEHAFNQMARQRPDEFAVGEALTQFRSELQSLGQIVTQLSQQRATQEFFAERNVRSAALDLAIKALPEAERMGDNGSVTIVAYAEAFLGWLKSGTQA
jgi:hypothetical protein